MLTQMRLIQLCDMSAVYPTLVLRVGAKGHILSLCKRIPFFKGKNGDLLATPCDVDQLHQRAFAVLKQNRKTLPARLKRLSFSLF